MPATPKRHPFESATPEARFLDDVVAANVRDLRVLARDPRVSQELLAEHMRALGHETWTSSTVSEVERGRRAVSTSELLALAIVLETDVLDLLDPTGVDGRQAAPVDYAVRPLPHDIESALPAVVVKHWLRGVVQVRFPRGPASFEVCPVEGHDDEFNESKRAWDKLSAERAQRKAERLANEEPS